MFTKQLLINPNNKRNCLSKRLNCSNCIINPYTFGALLMTHRNILKTKLCVMGRLEMFPSGFKILPCGFKYFYEIKGFVGIYI